MGCVSGIEGIFSIVVDEFGDTCRRSEIFWINLYRIDWHTVSSPCPSKELDGADACDDAGAEQVNVVKKFFLGDVCSELFNNVLLDFGNGIHVLLAFYDRFNVHCVGFPIPVKRELSTERMKVIRHGECRQDSAECDP